MVCMAVTTLEFPFFFLLEHVLEFGSFENLLARSGIALGFGSFSRTFELIEIRHTTLRALVKEQVQSSLFFIS